MKYLKSYNEGIRDFLKPKSEEDIKKSLNNLSDMEKIYHVIEYNLFNLVSKDHIKNIIKNLHFDEKIEVLSNRKIKNLYSIYELDDIKNDILNIFYELDDKDKNEILFFLKQHTLFNNSELEELETLSPQNESIRDFLKPKSEEDIKNILNQSSSDKKLEYIFKYNFKHLISDEEIKNILNQLSNEKKLDCIFKYNLKYLISNEEIKNILNYLSPIKKLLKGIEYKSIDLVKYAFNEGAILNYDRLSENEKFNVSRIFNKSCINGDVELIKIFLKDKDFDPSMDGYEQNNFAFISAYKRKQFDIVKLLFNDKRVRNTLTDKQIAFLEEKMPELFN
jgi:hypothetical protein